MTTNLGRFGRVRIENPKNYADTTLAQGARIFPYYAGYSTAFTSSILAGLDLPKTAVVFDPWNGSGTTTSAATGAGLKAIGQDLNPVMVMVAKASLLAKSEVPSLLPLAHSLLEEQAAFFCKTGIEPLEAWLVPNSAKTLRDIEARINILLVNHEEYASPLCEQTLSLLTPLAAFFYVALFRVVRSTLSQFVPSNPTWITRPKTHSNRLRPSPKTLKDNFIEEVRWLSDRLKLDTSGLEDSAHIMLGSSQSIKLPNESVDCIITSPPYCTRIDYAVATAPELAILRASSDDFSRIRRSLMGASTVPRSLEKKFAGLGQKCCDLLESIYDHPSKASRTYYYKNHFQYFHSLADSIKEISRVGKDGCASVFVVQDSYYKDVYNDIAGITIEMARLSGLMLSKREDFHAKRTMAGINPNSKKYVQSRSTMESVLCFIKG